MMWLRSTMLLAALALTAAGCGGPRKPAPREQESRARGPRVSGERVRLELTDASGQRAWEGSGRRLHAEVEEERAEMRDLTCRFYEKGQVVLEASAERGEVDWSRRTVALLGSVHARSTLGYGEIRADRVTWSVAERKVRASGNLEYTRRGMRATAPEMSGDTALKVIELTNVVMTMAESSATGKARR